MHDAADSDMAGETFDLRTVMSGVEVLTWPGASRGQDILVKGAWPPLPKLAYRGRLTS